jgi:hypothetical protein
MVNTDYEIMAAVFCGLTKDGRAADALFKSIE